MSVFVVLVCVLLSLGWVLVQAAVSSCCHGQDVKSSKRAADPKGNPASKWMKVQSGAKSASPPRSDEDPPPGSSTGAVSRFGFLSSLRSFPSSFFCISPIFVPFSVCECVLSCVFVCCVSGPVCLSGIVLVYVVSCVCVCVNNPVIVRLC